MTKEPILRIWRYVRKTVGCKPPSRIPVNQLLPLYKPPALGIVLSTDDLVVLIHALPGSLAVLYNVVPSAAVVLLLRTIQVTQFLAVFEPFHHLVGSCAVPQG